jgi:hypothetical protein
MKIKILWVLLFVLVTFFSYQILLHAQLPDTMTAAWDANPATDNVVNYSVYVDGNNVANPTSTSAPFTLTTVGAHTVWVTATNNLGNISPASASTIVDCTAAGCGVRPPAAPTGLRFTIP